MKMKMKSVVMLSSFSGWAKKDENVLVFASHDVVHGPQDTMWHFILELELRLQILVVNYTCNSI